MVVNGKKQKFNGYNVILEDTILFPEGGGQPDDHGKINGIDVLRVIRKGAEAIHFLPAPLDPGSEVKMEVNWTRRWDHMQQHSGQHVISAMAEALFNFHTTSWNLGERVSFVELDTPVMTSEQVAELESVVNEKIRAGLKMYPTLYEDPNAPELKEIRSRGLPDDHVGPVRMVTIETIENDMCCGTHVSNLGHLQSIKFVGNEKGKKGKTNLSFVIGNRVLEYLGKCVDSEKKLTGMLKGGPDQHISLLEKLQKSQKVAQKNATNLLREVASLEAKAFKSDLNHGNLLSLHKREGDFDYMSIVVNEVSDEAILKFITVGDEQGAGMFMLAGREEDLAILGPKVAEVMEGKGAGKKGRFMGKVSRLPKRSEAEKIVREFMAAKTQGAES